MKTFNWNRSLQIFTEPTKYDSNDINIEFVLKSDYDRIRKALKNECCCTGETNWTTGKPILCDPCETIERVENG